MSTLFRKKKKILRSGNLKILPGIGRLGKFSGRHKVKTKLSGSVRFFENVFFSSDMDFERTYFTYGCAQTAFGRAVTPRLTCDEVCFFFFCVFFFLRFFFFFFFVFWFFFFYIFFFFFCVFCFFCFYLFRSRVHIQNHQNDTQYFHIPRQTSHHYNSKYFSVKDFLSTFLVISLLVWVRRGEHSGIFWVGMCRPGHQIWTQFQNLPRSRNRSNFYTPL